MNNPSEVTPIARVPVVWIVYRDNRKDFSRAEQFGQLREMFSGRVNYDRAVEQARKMMENYQDGDFIMMVGDPALCLIVGAVALEYSGEDHQKLQLLRWDREDVEYRPLEVSFLDEEPAAAGSQVARPEHFRELDGKVEAQVTKKSRYS